MKCPRCQYQRQLTDQAPAWQCPSCGVAYAKASAANTQAASIRARSAAIPIEDPEPTPLELHEESERLTLAARGQRILVFSILLNFLIRAIGQAITLPGLAFDAMYLCVAVYSLAGVVKICSGLGKSQNSKLLCMTLSFFPLINLIMMVYLSVRATRLLRAAGKRVGLLGARS